MSIQRFGEKLRALRQRRGLSQQKLADELGFSRIHLHHLEVGKRNPHAVLLVRISQIFAVPVDALVKVELVLPPE